MKRLYLLLILILTGCTGGSSSSPPPKPVVAAEVVQKDVPIFLDTIGNVFALSTIDVTPQVSGELIKAHVGQGDYVEAGEMLYTIDPAPYQAQLLQAEAALMKDEASLSLANDRVRRYTPLLEDDFVSELTYEGYQSEAMEMAAQVLEDKAAIEEAVINLNYCFIKAPISGRTSQYEIYPGNIVSPEMQTPLTTIRQIVPIEVRFTLAQTNFQRLKQAEEQHELKFTATLPEDPKSPFEGQVYFFDNQINLSTDRSAHAPHRWSHRPPLGPLHRPSPISDQCRCFPRCRAPPMSPGQRPKRCT